MVELLRWDALLPNGEKTSEQAGVLLRVSQSYDPDSKKLKVSGTVAPTFGQSDIWPAAGSLGPAFVYLRVWNRGNDTASAPAIAFTAGAAVSLTGVGLNITFTRTEFRPGDFWIIAARPESPNRVVPWQLETGRGAHGVRRFLALLGTIEWTPAASGAFTGIPHDCRPTFLPLTRVRGCCTRTVGDGTGSFGQFSSIQAAIDSLPAEGGEVCLLAGVYEQSFRIEGRQNVHVHGCGDRTVLRGDAESKKAVVSILNSKSVSLCSFRVECPEVSGVVMVGSKSKNAQKLEDITVEDVTLDARDRAAIVCRLGFGISILENRITAGTLQKPVDQASTVGREPLVFLQAKGLLVERNLIRVRAERSLVSPLGGLQIGGASEDVEIRRNRIEGGNGNGITLGSVAFVGSGDDSAAVKELFRKAQAAEPSTGYVMVDEAGCVHPEDDPKIPTDPSGNPLRPVSEGDVELILIDDNVISGMGGNGIASAVFPFRQRPVFAGVRLLTIDRNRIVECLQLDRARSTSAPPKVPLGFGGISLVEVEYMRVRQNVIERNGKSHVDPVCGVVVVLGAALEFENNRIAHNGEFVGDAAPAMPGPRGGIFLNLAVPPFDSSGQETMAFEVTENTILSEVGPALHAVAAGDAAIHGNYLSSEMAEPRLTGSSAFARLSALGGGVVRVVLAAPFSSAGKETSYLKYDNSYPSPKVGKPSRQVGTLPAGTTDPAAGAATSDGSVGFGRLTFNDNQVDLGSSALAGNLLFSATLLMSVGDLSIDANQFRAVFPTTEVLFTNLFATALSLRATANVISDQLASFGVSTLTVGAFNQTSLNQASRCIIAFGLQPLLVVKGNRSVWGVLTLQDAPLCESVGKLLQAMPALKNLAYVADSKEN